MAIPQIRRENVTHVSEANQMVMRK
jgi:hypothetical protein